MSEDLSLHSLVSFCLAKRVSPAVFHSLLQQVNHKHEVTINDVSQLLATQDRMDTLHVMYIVTSSLRDQTIALRVSNVLSHLSNATPTNQHLILTGIISQLRECPEFPFTSHDTPEVISALFSYLTAQQQQNNVDLLELGIQLLVSIGSSLPDDINTSALTGEQTELVHVLSAEIKDSKPILADELVASLEKFQRKKTRSQSITRGSISLSSMAGLPGPQPHSSFMKSNKQSKLVWINAAIQSWSTHKPSFLGTFEQFVKVKNNQNILNELVAASFEGYIVSLKAKPQSPIFAKNWELFLLKRFPLIIKDLKLKNIESSLMNALTLDPKVLQAIKMSTDNNINNGDSNNDNTEDMFASFPHSSPDIRHEFLRSCIALQLLPVGAYESILKQDASADGRKLITTDQVLDQFGQPVSLEASLKKSLIDINTEFIPLEESGLLEFFKSVSSMEGTKQVEFSNHITSCITTFIANNDTSHLYRLSLALALVPECLHAVLFHVSPTTFLKPIMNFLDTWQTNSDDMNFQDTYSSFGCIFLLFLLTVKDFNIPLVQLISMKDQIDHESFCINFLTNIGTSSWKSPTNDLNQHKSEVLSGWMAALFDSGGISDDLMRLSTVQECFELFPVIFQQAFVACKQGLTDVETVKGGLEYFLQPFLLSAIVGLLSWCEGYLWKAQDVELVVSLLKTLVTPLELSGESIYIHKIVMSIFGADLYKNLSELDSNSSPLRVDAGFLSSLRQSVASAKTNGFFEIDMSPKIKHFLSSPSGQNEISLSSVFHTEFQSLLSWGQSSSVARYDHLFVPNMQRLLGESGLIDAFVAEICHAQQLNKNVQTVIDLSAFVLVIDSVGFSSDSRRMFLTSLKEETIPEKPTDTLIPGYDRMTTLVLKKRAYGTSEAGANFGILYEKLLETVKTITPLD